MITFPYFGSGTIGATEFSLPNNSTTLTPTNISGVYQAIINFRSLGPSGSYRIRLKDKVTTSGTQRVIRDSQIYGVIPCLYKLPAFTLFHGWDLTINKVTGSDSFISWSIAKVE